MLIVVQLGRKSGFTYVVSAGFEQELLSPKDRETYLTSIDVNPIVCSAYR
jgi:hypothetical protein